MAHRDGTGWVTLYRAGALLPPIVQGQRRDSNGVITDKLKSRHLKATSMTQP